MDMSTVLNVNHIQLNMIAKTKEEAIEELTDVLVQGGFISDKDAFLRDVWRREEEGPTAFDNLIALPHGQSSAVSHTTLAIGRTQDTIAWQTSDDCNVRCIILYAICLENTDTTAIRLLKQVSMALADEETIEKLLTENKPENIIEIFNQYRETDDDF